MDAAGRHSRDEMARDNHFQGDGQEPAAQTRCPWQARFDTHQRNPGLAMTRDRAKKDRVAGPRKRAEAGRDREVTDIPEMSNEELHTLVQRLQSHQIELETENEELRRTQEGLAESRDRYFDLYDFAPVGYLTLSGEGLVIEANRTLAEMLGVERQALVDRPLSTFIVPDDQEVLDQHRQKILESKERDTCQVRMRCPDAEPI